MCRRVCALVVLVCSMATFADAAAAIARYRELPYGACRFVDEQFHVKPDVFQEETLIKFADPQVQRISLQAAAGVGKSAVMSWCAWYFLGTQCLELGQHPKGAVTGITDQNLRDNFWAEMAKWQGVSPMLSHTFQHTDRRIFAKDHPNTWFLARRAWPKSGTVDEQGATLSGLHSLAVASFIDESGGIPPTVLRAAEQALADGPRFGKIMQAGNPISLEGMLYAAANQLRSQWTIIIVTNDPDDPRRASRGDIEWARQQIQLYGRDNPWVMSYILGKFPPNSLNTLLGIDDVEAAMARHLQPDDYEWQQKRLGVDVARFGDDRTVIFARQGLNARCAPNNPIVMRAANTNQIVARIMMAKQRWGSELELIDNSFAWGNGVVDNLLTAGVAAQPVDFAGKANDNRYHNRRAEGWLLMADAIKRGAALPKVGELVAELTTPTYTFHEGRFLLENKDQVKKRLGRSPDLADALALTYMLPELPSGMMRQMQDMNSGKVKTDYDPFASR